MLLGRAELLASLQHLLGGAEDENRLPKLQRLSAEQRHMVWVLAFPGAVQLPHLLPRGFPQLLASLRISTFTSLSTLKSPACTDITSLEEASLASVRMQ